MANGCPNGSSITGHDRDGNAICDNNNRSSSPQRRTPNPSRRKTPNPSRRKSSNRNTIRRAAGVSRNIRRRPNTNTRNINKNRNAGFPYRQDTLEFERILELPKGYLHKYDWHPKLDETDSNGVKKWWSSHSGECSGTGEFCNTSCPSGTMTVGWCAPTGCTYYEYDPETGMGGWSDCTDGSGTCTGWIKCFQRNMTN